MSLSPFLCFAAVQSIFLRVLAAIYIFAFVSIYYQIPGLWGPHGLTPADPFLHRLRQQHPKDHLSLHPTLMWFSDVLVPEHTRGPAEVPSETLLCQIALLGSFLSLLAFLRMPRVASSSLVFAILWGLYLSIFYVGQTFLSFQWDILLLETGFVAIFFAPLWPSKEDGSRTVCVRYIVSKELLRWLLFRLMFASGVVKLTSGCPTWWSLTALHYHYETQCLPNPLSWFVHQLPDIMQRFSVASTFVIEIGHPLLFYCPFRTGRILAAVSQIFLQLLIILTGNYNFFNLLTIALSLTLLDDRFLFSVTPQRLRDRWRLKVPKSNGDDWFWEGIILFGLFTIGAFVSYFPMSVLQNGRVKFSMDDVKKLSGWVARYSPVVALSWTGIILAIHLAGELARQLKSTGVALVSRGAVVRYIFSAVAVIACSTAFLASCVAFSHGLGSTVEDVAILPSKLMTLSYHKTSHLHLTSSYGLFRRMTGVGGRPEIIIEGSLDPKGNDWMEYQFKYKPGNVTVMPGIVLPHQPRLDWQMWFAALSSYQQHPWMIHLIAKLLSNSPPVLKLLKTDPFPDRPPLYVRCCLYKYQFTSYKNNQTASSDWWFRRDKTEYLPAVSRETEPLKKFLKDNGYPPMSESTHYEPNPWADWDIVQAIVLVVLTRCVFWLFK